MGNFQVYDALNILFKLKKPPIKHLEGFILLRKKGGKLQNFSRTLDQKFQFKNLKEFPNLIIKAGASMVEGMYAVVIMSC
jgi:hypothetical protein